MHVWIDQANLENVECPPVSHVRGPQLYVRGPHKVRRSSFTPDEGAGPRCILGKYTRWARIAKEGVRMTGLVQLE